MVASSHPLQHPAISLQSFQDVAAIHVCNYTHESSIREVGICWGGWFSEVCLNLQCDQAVGTRFKSRSQQSRVISESWYGETLYCFACDSDEVKKLPNNTRHADFVCPKCGHLYELKTVQKRPKTTLPDGSFSQMIEGIQQGKAPSLCLLERSADWHVRALNAFHSSFLLPHVIEKRPPLSELAKRKGAVLCNIRMDRITADAEVGIIRQSSPLPVPEVRRRFQRFLPLNQKSPEARGWTVLTLATTRSLGTTAFELADLYALEGQFAAVYPENRHIRDKIRQQLQVLRDMGVVEFLGQGSYRFLD